MKSIKVKKILVVCIMSFISVITFAQTVIIDGEIRPRIENRDGFTKPLLTTNDPGVSAIQRTRIGMTFTSAAMSTQITLQDSRTYGQTPNSSSVATTGIFEAWAQMLVAPGVSFKIGRQALQYDDGRLFSASDWSNTGTSHDVALIKYCVNDFQGHLGLAYNNNSIISSETYYSPISNYRYMGYVWLTKNIADALNLSILGVDEGVQDTTKTKNGVNYLKTNMYHAYTFGGNLKYSNESLPVSALATAYFQAGKNSAGSKMNGKMLAIKINYKFSDIISANIGTDYVSGDNNTTDGTQSNFKKLYGSDHTFYGLMDYWDVALTQGLLDYYAGVTGKIGKNLSLTGTYHLFNSEFSGKNSKGIAFGKDLGSEFDLIVNYKLNTWTSVQAGWCTYFTTNNTLVAKNIITSATIPAIRTPQWAYVMFSIKPKFL
ncbi:MAG: alginate export family protein [Paludibacter sp.]|nr:alginate export family protein [Paludibacter sp.]